MEYKVDPNFGVTTETRDINGQTTFYYYDGFGREKENIAADGTKTTISYKWVKQPESKVSDIHQVLQHAVYIVSRQTTNEPLHKEYYDVLNRKIATTTQNAQGKTVWQLICYDNLGRVVKRSKPFFEQDPIYYTKFSYDVLGRVIHSILPDKSKTWTEYHDFSIFYINQKNHKLVKKHNALGELVEAVDNEGSKTVFEYDPYSNLITTKDSAHNVFRFIYDSLGRKIKIHDPDKGDWDYKYDILGNLLEQTDALGNSTTFRYDKLNRLIERTDKSTTSAWEYDTAENGVGKIAKITSVDLNNKNLQARVMGPQQAALDGVQQSVKVFKYDAMGRLISMVTAINNEKYTHSYTYDNNSRIETETYPNGLSIKNTYNLGYLVKVTDVNATKIFWGLNAQDALGNVISETHSNGLITNYTYNVKSGFLEKLETRKGYFNRVHDSLFSSASVKLQDTTKPVVQDDEVIQSEIYESDKTVGNIAVRYDVINNIRETFSYDNLNRLNTAQVTGEKNLTLRIDYDALGNITHKSDVGTYTYGENGAGPHAVTSIVREDGSRFSYTYNKNGDQTKATMGDMTRTIDYTSYSKPSHINIYKEKNVTQNSQPTTSVSFYYDAERDKIVRVDSTKDKLITTYYLGKYELVSIKKHSGPTIVQQKAYIGPSTIVIKTEEISSIKKENCGYSNMQEKTEFCMQSATNGIGGDVILQPFCRH